MNTIVVKNVEKGLIMWTLDDFDEEKVKNFKAVVDEMILDFSSDPELKEGLDHIDKLAEKNNLDFYEMVLNLMMIDDIMNAIRNYEEEKDK